MRLPSHFTYKIPTDHSPWKRVKIYNYDGIAYIGDSPQLARVRYHPGVVEIRFLTSSKNVMFMWECTNFFGQFVTMWPRKEDRMIAWGLDKVEPFPKHLKETTIAFPSMNDTTGTVMDYLTKEEIRRWVFWGAAHE